MSRFGDFVWFSLPLAVPIFIIVVVFLFSGGLQQDGSSWSGEWRCNIMDGCYKVYKFVDDSVCPCSANTMFFTKECNEEIDRILSGGYDEVEFC